MAFGSTYLSEQGRRNLHTYQYKGSDNSLIYKFVLTPLNNFLIPFFPLWMAPNLITLIGLGITFANYLLMEYYAPTFSGIAPSWAYVACAVGLFAYQTLDNLDGKQARRTGTSSPLGLLFDHGCDALNCTVSTCTFVSVIQFGTSWKTMAMWACATTTFYFNTWEEYYTGDLYLPIINGPTEGLLFVVIADLFTAYIGAEVWTQPSPVMPEYFNNNDLVLLLTVGLTVCTVTTHTIKVLQVHRSGETHAAEQPNFIRAVLLLLPYLSSVAFLFKWAEHSQIQVLEDHGRLLLWTFGLFAANLLTKLMISHLCSQPYAPYASKTTWCMLLAMVCVASTLENCCQWIPRHELFGELEILWALFAVCLTSYVHLVVSLISEVSTELKINCLSIPYPPKNM